jgi:hypothetical protein
VSEDGTALEEEVVGWEAGVADIQDGALTVGFEGAFGSLLN